MKKQMDPMDLLKFQQALSGKAPKAPARPTRPGTEKARLEKKKREVSLQSLQSRLDEVMVRLRALQGLTATESLERLITQVQGEMARGEVEPAGQTLERIEHESVSLTQKVVQDALWQCEEKVMELEMSSTRREGGDRLVPAKKLVADLKANLQEKRWTKALALAKAATSEIDELRRVQVLVVLDEAEGFLDLIEELGAESGGHREAIDAIHASMGNKDFESALGAVLEVHARLAHLRNEHLDGALSSARELVASRGKGTSKTAAEELLRAAATALADGQEDTAVGALQEARALVDPDEKRRTHLRRELKQLAHQLREAGREGIGLETVETARASAVTAYEANDLTAAASHLEVAQNEFRRLVGALREVKLLVATTSKLLADRAVHGGDYDQPKTMLTEAKEYLRQGEVELAEELARSAKEETDQVFSDLVTTSVAEVATPLRSVQRPELQRLLAEIDAAIAAGTLEPVPGMLAQLRRQRTALEGHLTLVKERLGSMRHELSDAAAAGIDASAAAGVAADAETALERFDPTGATFSYTKARHLLRRSSFEHLRAMVRQTEDELATLRVAGIEVVEVETLLEGLWRKASHDRLGEAGEAAKDALARARQVSAAWEDWAAAAQEARQQVGTALLLGLPTEEQQRAIAQAGAAARAGRIEEACTRIRAAATALDHRSREQVAALLSEATPIVEKTAQVVAIPGLQARLAEAAGLWEHGLCAPAAAAIAFAKERAAEARTRYTAMTRSLTILGELLAQAQTFGVDLGGTTPLTEVRTAIKSGEFDAAQGRMDALRSSMEVAYASALGERQQQLEGQIVELAAVHIAVAPLRSQLQEAVTESRSKNFLHAWDRLRTIERGIGDLRKERSRLLYALEQATDAVGDVEQQGVPMDEARGMLERARTLIEEGTLVEAAGIVAGVGQIIEEGEESYARRRLEVLKGALGEVVQLRLHLPAIETARDQAATLLEEGQAIAALRAIEGAISALADQRALHRRAVERREELVDHLRLSAKVALEVPEAAELEMLGARAIEGGEYQQAGLLFEQATDATVRRLTQDLTARGASVREELAQARFEGVFSTDLEESLGALGELLGKRQVALAHELVGSVATNLQDRRTLADDVVKSLTGVHGAIDAAKAAGVKVARAEVVLSQADPLLAEGKYHEVLRLSRQATETVRKQEQGHTAAAARLEVVLAGIERAKRLAVPLPQTSEALGAATRAMEVGEYDEALVAIAAAGERLHHEQREGLPQRLAQLRERVEAEVAAGESLPEAEGDLSAAEGLLRDLPLTPEAAAQPLEGALLRLLAVTADLAAVAARLSAGEVAVQQLRDEVAHATAQGLVLPDIESQLQQVQEHLRSRRHKRMRAALSAVRATVREVTADLTAATAALEEAEALIGAIDYLALNLDGPLEAIEAAHRSFDRGEYRAAAEAASSAHAAAASAEMAAVGRAIVEAQSLQADLQALGLPTPEGGIEEAFSALAQRQMRSAYEGATASSAALIKAKEQYRAAAEAVRQARGALELAAVWQLHVEEAPYLVNQAVSTLSKARLGEAADLARRSISALATAAADRAGTLAGKLESEADQLHALGLPTAKFDGLLGISLDLVACGSPALAIQTIESTRGEMAALQRQHDWVSTNIVVLQEQLRRAPEFDVRVKDEVSSLTTARKALTKGELEGATAAVQLARRATRGNWVPKVEGALSAATEKAATLREHGLALSEVDDLLEQGEQALAADQFPQALEVISRARALLSEREAEVGDAAALLKAVRDLIIVGNRLDLPVGPYEDAVEQLEERLSRGDVEGVTPAAEQLVATVRADFTASLTAEIKQAQHRLEEVRAVGVGGIDDQFIRSARQLLTQYRFPAVREALEGGLSLIDQRQRGHERAVAELDRAAARIVLLRTAPGVSALGDSADTLEIARGAMAEGEYDLAMELSFEAANTADRLGAAQMLKEIERLDDVAVGAAEGTHRSNLHTHLERARTRLEGGSERYAKAIESLGAALRCDRLLTQQAELERLQLAIGGIPVRSTATDSAGHALAWTRTTIDSGEVAHGAVGLDVCRALTLWALLDERGVRLEPAAIAALTGAGRTLAGKSPVDARDALEEANRPLGEAARPWLTEQLDAAMAEVDALSTQGVRLPTVEFLSATEAAMERGGYIDASAVLQAGLASVRSAADSHGKAQGRIAALMEGMGTIEEGLDTGEVLELVDAANGLCEEGRYAAALQSCDRAEEALRALRIRSLGQTLARLRTFLGEISLEGAVDLTAPLAQLGAAEQALSRDDGDVALTLVEQSREQALQQRIRYSRVADAREALREIFASGELPLAEFKGLRSRIAAVLERDYRAELEARGRGEGTERPPAIAPWQDAQRLLVQYQTTLQEGLTIIIDHRRGMGLIESMEAGMRAGDYAGAEARLQECWTQVLAAERTAAQVALQNASEVVDQLGAAGLDASLVESLLARARSALEGGEADRTFHYVIEANRSGQTLLAAKQGVEELLEGGAELLSVAQNVGMLEADLGGATTLFESARQTMRSQDFETAHDLAEQGVTELRARLNDRIGEVRVEVATASAEAAVSQVPVDVVEEALAKAQEHLDAKRFLSAWKEVTGARASLEALRTGYERVAGEVGPLRERLDQARSRGVVVTGVEEALASIAAGLARGDLRQDRAILAAKEQLHAATVAHATTMEAQARATLKLLQDAGKDTSAHSGVLRDSAAALEEGEYADALELLHDTAELLQTDLAALLNGRMAKVNEDLARAKAASLELGGLSDRSRETAARLRAKELLAAASQLDAFEQDLRAVVGAKVTELFAALDSLIGSAKKQEIEVPEVANDRAKAASQRDAGALLEAAQTLRGAFDLAQQLVASGLEERLRLTKLAIAHAALLQIDPSRLQTYLGRAEDYLQKGNADRASFYASQCHREAERLIAKALPVAATTVEGEVAAALKAKHPSASRAAARLTEARAAFTAKDYPESLEGLQHTRLLLGTAEGGATTDAEFESQLTQARTLLASLAAAELNVTDLEEQLTTVTSLAGEQQLTEAKGQLEAFMATATQREDDHALVRRRYDGARDRIAAAEQAGIDVEEADDLLELALADVLNNDFGGAHQTLEQVEATLTSLLSAPPAPAKEPLPELVEVRGRLTAAAAMGADVDAARQLTDSAEQAWRDDRLDQARTLAQNASASIRRAILALRPEVVVDLQLQEELTVGRWSAAALSVSNIGKAPARNIAAKVSGGLFARRAEGIDLEVGQAKEVPLQVKPTDFGQIAYKVTVTYVRSSDNTSYTTEIDKVGTVPRPA